ncbi:hypothetical protein ASG19_13940 [Rhizobium sp. Leaf306]|nr:hypothetical protein ASG19_13940 [Rhizobium sp. Leaf306]
MPGVGRAPIVGNLCYTIAARAVEMITKGGDTYYIYKRVPKRYAAVEKRGTIWLSVGTDSAIGANRKAGRV